MSLPLVLQNSAPADRDVAAAGGVAVERVGAGGDVVLAGRVAEPARRCRWRRCRCRSCWSRARRPRWRCCWSRSCWSRARGRRWRRCRRRWCWRAERRRRSRRSVCRSCCRTARRNRSPRSRSRWCWRSARMADGDVAAAGGEVGHHRAAQPDVADAGEGPVEEGSRRRRRCRCCRNRRCRRRRGSSRRRRRARSRRRSQGRSPKPPEGGWLAGTGTERGGHVTSPFWWLGRGQEARPGCSSGFGVEAPPPWTPAYARATEAPKGRLCLPTAPVQVTRRCPCCGQPPALPVDRTKSGYKVAPPLGDSRLTGAMEGVRMGTRRVAAGSPGFAEGAQVARGPRSRLVRRAALLFATLAIGALALAARADAYVYWTNLRHRHDRPRQPRRHGRQPELHHRPRQPPEGWRSTAPTSTGRISDRQDRARQPRRHGREPSFIAAPTSSGSQVAVDGAHVYWVSKYSDSAARPPSPTFHVPRYRRDRARQPRRHGRRPELHQRH